MSSRTRGRGRAPAVASVADPAISPVADPIGAIEPAIDAAAARAAVERITDPVAEAATTPAVAPVDDAPIAAGPAEATVLPEPTLVAEPHRPQPLVTASPPLAAEPNAMDVVKAEIAEAEREAGLPPADPVADRGGPHFAAAGQPMLAIQPVAAVTAATVAAEALDPVTAFSGLAQDWPEKVTVVTVVGPQRGRWRAGLAFGPTPRRFLGTSLSERQLDALLADPQLAVGISEVGQAELLAVELDQLG